MYWNSCSDDSVPEWSSSCIQQQNPFAFWLYLDSPSFNSSIIFLLHSVHGSYQVPTKFKQVCLENARISEKCSLPWWSLCLMEGERHISSYFQYRAGMQQWQTEVVGRQEGDIHCPLGFQTTCPNFWLRSLIVIYTRILCFNLFLFVICFGCTSWHAGS